MNPIKQTLKGAVEHPGSGLVLTYGGLLGVIVFQSERPLTWLVALAVWSIFGIPWLITSYQLGGTIT
jgi:hypothetical protein